MSPAIDVQRLTDIAMSGRVLGALFYYAPDSDAAAPLIAMMRHPGWREQWPWQDPQFTGIAAAITDGITYPDEPLPVAFQRLFIGPDALPSPPWGSVWLDKENVLFGDSMLALRQWMRDNGIEYQMQHNEPDDHFATLLMMTAWLKTVFSSRSMSYWHGICCPGQTVF